MRKNKNRKQRKSTGKTPVAKADDREYLDDPRYPVFARLLELPGDDPVFAAIGHLLASPELVTDVGGMIEEARYRLDAGGLEESESVGEWQLGSRESEDGCFRVKIPNSRLERFGIFPGDVIALSADDPAEGEEALAVIKGKIAIGRYSELPRGRIMITPLVQEVGPKTVSTSDVDALFRFHGVVCRRLNH